MVTITPSLRETPYAPVSPTTDFPVGFPIFGKNVGEFPATDLEVEVNGEKRTDFTVIATFTEGTSTDAIVRMNSGVTGDVIVRGKRTPRRTDQYMVGAPLRIQDHNYSLNRLEAEMQELRRDADSNTDDLNNMLSEVTDLTDRAENAAAESEAAKDASETAKQEAEDAKQAAELAAERNWFAFETRQQVETTEVPPFTNYIRTAGYLSVGDGGASFYKRVASEPVHSRKVQSLDGSWFEEAELQENAAQGGAVGDNSTINTASFNSYRTDALARDGRIFVPRGTYRVADAFSVKGLDIEIQPGGSLVNEAGSTWGGSMDGIDMGGSSASPISSERAFGDLRGNTRITAPGMIYVVDGDGVDPTGPIHTNVAFFRRGYRGRISNSYTVAQNVEAYVSYGRGMATGTRASGSMRVIGQRMQVFSAENGDTGVTELQAAAHSVRFNHDGDIANGLNIWIRETTGSGKVSTNANDYDKYLAGETIFVQKYNPGRSAAAVAAGDTYVGAFGAVITTHPQPGGFNGGMPLTQPTYPLDALLALSGYTGPNWSSAYSGHSAQATAGAFFALTIGGTQGGIWTGANRSRFDRGIFVTDCIYDGLVVDGAHPLKDATFSSIRTTANSGRVVLGLDSSAITNARVVIGSPSGATDDAIRIVGSSHATSERASINFNNKFVVGVDQAGTGANVFSIYDATNAKTVMGISALGELYLPALPTSADGTRVWKDTNGFLKVG